MNPRSLELISNLRGKNQSELAKMANVCRQAVSQWLHASKSEKEVGILSTHLKRLAEGLQVTSDFLLQPLPVLDNPSQAKELETLYNWDRLYGSLNQFVIALVKGELPAFARLVQVNGLFMAAKTMGQSAWTLFPKYKKWIRPGRREKLELLWNLYSSHKLN